jgi:hypothetical protein
MQTEIHHHLKFKQQRTPAKKKSNHIRRFIKDYERREELERRHFIKTNEGKN